MNLKEVVDAVSAQENPPAREVRAVALALLEQIALAVEAGDGFRSLHINVTAWDLPERTVTGPGGVEKTVPAQRIGILRRARRGADNTGLAGRAAGQGFD